MTAVRLKMTGDSIVLSRSAQQLIVTLAFGLLLCAMVYLKNELSRK
jgi:hypothetical protein